MVDPNVLQAVGYDPEEVTNFAFGLGVERFVLAGSVDGHPRVLSQQCGSCIGSDAGQRRLQTVAAQLRQVDFSSCSFPGTGSNNT